jgi:hypothetical protein
MLLKPLLLKLAKQLKTLLTNNSLHGSPCLNRL